MELMCMVCGKIIDEKKALRRRLNGKIHLLCGIACEVKWEKQNMIGVCGLAATRLLTGLYCSVTIPEPH